MKVEVWTLAVRHVGDGLDGETSVSVHKSLDDAMQSLRDNFDDIGEYEEFTDAHMMALLLQDQNVQASAELHELEI